MGCVLQINTSRGGVPKRAVGEGYLTVNGIDGDLCAHPEIHGGPRQAVLVITSEGIAEISAMGYPVFAGALGENLTTAGVDRRAMRVGQRYAVGEAIIELTKLRAPCATLNRYNALGLTIGKAIYDECAKAGAPASARWALGGFYAAVVRPGWIRTNDIIALLDPGV